MDPVGEDVRAELQRLGGESGAAADTTDAWTAAVGDEIARNAWPARTQADGTLVVHVRDAIWGFELTQQAPEISARLPGRPKLRFVPGPLPADVPAAMPAEPLEASPEEAHAAEEMVAEISDRELRESVAKVIKSALVRTRDDRSV
jgi:hypothetical protein